MLHVLLHSPAASLLDIDVENAGNDAFFRGWEEGLTNEFRESDVIVRKEDVRIADLGAKRPSILNDSIVGKTEKMVQCRDGTKDQLQRGRMKHCIRACMRSAKNINS